jgi:hypothetical protein
MAQSTVQKIQGILDVETDGIWGPKSQKALNEQIGNTGAKGNPTLAKIQRLLGVEDDGFWGPNSQQALNNELEGVGGSGGGNGPFEAEASSFADPKDVEDFKKCKAQGKTDKQCFKVGDNGIGKFGKITAQTTTPMVAIHPSDATKRWGSMNAAAHRMVRVSLGSRSVTASVEDQLGVAGRIDLNPAAAAQLGLNPPFLKDCTWEWV